MFPLFKRESEQWKRKRAHDLRHIHIYHRLNCGRYTTQLHFAFICCCVALLLYLIYNIQIHVRTFYCFDADPPTFDGRIHCCRFREHIDDKSHSWQRTFCFIRHRNHAWMDSYQIISWYATFYTHTIRSMYGWNMYWWREKVRESERDGENEKRFSCRLSRRGNEITLWMR